MVVPDDSNTGAGFMILPLRQGLLRGLTRRRFLKHAGLSLGSMSGSGAALLVNSAVGVTGLSSAAVRAHNDPGRVQPALPAPRLSLTLQNGSKTSLPDLLRGRCTALQLMFTGCSATCPIQGAMFSQVQDKLAGRADLQLLSVSIDPLSDDPRAMRTWLARFGARHQWMGATPAVKELDLWWQFLRARNAGPDRHTPQVYFFNSRGELALRSTDFPSPDDVARLLHAASGSVLATLSPDSRQSQVSP
jgi:protein SCO1